MPNNSKTVWKCTNCKRSNAKPLHDSSAVPVSTTTCSSQSRDSEPERNGVQEAVPVVTEQTAEELADGDVSGAEAVEVESASKDDGIEAGPVEPLSQGDSCEEAEENVGA
ncbi:hypothetical protein ACROYT_G015283 [Oculina patagonica]